MAIPNDSLRVFENVSVRDSHLPSPVKGQACVLLETGEMLIYYGTTLGWRPPWNLPWGQIGTIDVLTDHTATTNYPDINWFSDLVLEWTPVPGRRYRFDFNADLGSAADGNITEVLAAYYTDLGLKVRFVDSIKHTMTSISTESLTIVQHTKTTDYSTLGEHGYWILGVENIIGTGASLRPSSIFIITDVGPLTDPPA